MGLFGGDDKKDAETAALAAELERIQALPLDRLAEEIMSKVWGRGGTQDAYENENVSLQLYDVAKPFNPTESIFGVDLTPLNEIQQLLEEALQLLQHARLVVPTFSGGDHATMYFRPTRAGLEAIDRGEVARRLAAIA
jgi:hypothetical protein